MADFRLFDIAAVRHLGFVLRVRGPPTNNIWWFCDCAKFGCNRRSNFGSIQILIFCALNLKMSIYAPKIGVLGVWPPKWGTVWTRPQKALPCAETRRMTYRSSKSDHRCGLSASRRIKQKLKIKKIVLYGDWRSTSARAVTLTLTMGAGQGHTVVHLSSSTTCIPSLIKIA